MAKHHYKKSPSATERWLNCPGSLELSIGLERKSTRYSTEGDEAHDVAEAALKSGKQAYLISENKDVAAYVQVYVDDINRARSQYRVLSEHTEYKLKHATIDDFGGTMDHMMLYEDNGKLVAHVWDYKHGIGVVVDAEENMQVLSYFAIIQSYYEFLDIAEFRVTIVQPRTYSEEKIKYWACGPERVQQHVAAILDAISDTTRFKAGDWCQWCPAITICDEVRSKVVELADTEFETIRDDVPTLLELMRIETAVSTLFKQIPAALLEAYRKQPIPGMKVIRTSTHRKWRDAETTARTLQEMGVPEDSIYEPRKVRSPAQIEGEVDKVVIAPLYYSPPGSLKVVPDSSRGKPVDPNDTSDTRDFGEMFDD